VSGARFYFDLASPDSYLAAERIGSLLPRAEWIPVLARGLAAPAPAPEPGQLAARAAELGLQPFRLPDPFPFDSALAMRVATYAKAIGRTVAFAQAAFRQAYAGGHDLAREDFVLISAAACEMHPHAVLAAARSQSVAAQLAEATATARAAGVATVPAIAARGSVHCGAEALEDAAKAVLA